MNTIDYLINYIDLKISQLNMPVEVITPEELEQRISQIPVPSVTEQDVNLAATAVDAKFDMLRAAIRESVDFDTLKARLLAVLE